MKIKIKLANGLEFAGNLTAEQLQKAEQSKYFRQANKKGKKMWCYLGIGEGNGQSCSFCGHQSKCKENKENRVNFLNSYINYLSNLI